MVQLALTSCQGLSNVIFTGMLTSPENWTSLV